MMAQDMIYFGDYFICIWQECISKSHSWCFVNYLPLYVCFLCVSLFVLLVLPLSLSSYYFAQFFWDGRLVYIFSGILMFWSAFTSIKFPFPFAPSTNFNMTCLYNWVKIFIFYCGFCLDTCYLEVILEVIIMFHNFQAGIDYLITFLLLTSSIMHCNQ